MSERAMGRERRGKARERAIERAIERGGEGGRGIRRGGYRKEVVARGSAREERCVCTNTDWRRKREGEGVKLNQREEADKKQSTAVWRTELN